MACATCGTMILFGGEKLGGRRYCNAKCLEAGRVTQAADRVPDDIVDETAAALHRGPCPVCQGPGPVDLHVSHTAWSAVVMTSWNSKVQLCCQSCGRAARLKAIAFTGVLGWWGFPWGLIAAPVQIVRNLAGGQNPSRPSAELRDLARREVAARVLHRIDAEPLKPRVQFRRAERAAEQREGDGERPA